MSQGTPQGNKMLQRQTAEWGEQEGGSNTGKERVAQLQFSPQGSLLKAICSLGDGAEHRFLI